jgi:threonine 3-dehydrogenase
VATPPSCYPRSRSTSVVPRRALAPYFAGGGRIEFRERAVPDPGPGQLLLRVRANALCGSDRGQYVNGSSVVPGHEAAGEVVAVGEGTTVRAGTPGVVYLMDFCGRCRSCRLGHTNQCFDKRSDMGFTQDGGYGPYELVHETNFFAAPGVTATEATLLLDAMGTTAHAIVRAQLVRADIESVAVAGAGPIGLGLVAMCRITLGEQVALLASDLDERRLELASALGATAVPAEPGALTAATRRLGIHGVDVAFDSTGRQRARQQLLDALTGRGVLVCVGHGEGLELDVTNQLIAPERAVLGSEYFRYDELPVNLERLHDHRAYLGSLVTHRFPIERIEEAFATFFRGGTGKVVVEQAPS